MTDPGMTRSRQGSSFNAAKRGDSAFSHAGIIAASDCRNPADERFTLPLPQRVQYAGTRPPLCIDGCGFAPDDVVGHLDEGRRNFVEGGHPVSR